jgi:hypothetical protein
MSNVVGKALLVAAGGAGLALGLTLLSATAAQAQERSAQCRPTPPSFNWDYDEHCRRVPKNKAAKGPDASSRETVQRGTCVKIREKTEDGYRIVDRCD